MEISNKPTEIMDIEKTKEAVGKAVKQVGKLLAGFALTGSMILGSGAQAQAHRGPGPVGLLIGGAVIGGGILGNIISPRHHKGHNYEHEPRHYYKPAPRHHRRPPPRNYGPHHGPHHGRGK